MRIRLVALFAVLVALTGLGALLSTGAGAAPSPTTASAYPPVGPTTGVPTSGVPSSSQAPSSESTSQVPSSPESSGQLPTSESAPSTPAESTAQSQSAEASSESQGSQASSQAAAANQNNNQSGLAFTGTPVGILLEVAAALLAVGGIALFAAKRRGRHA